MSRNVIVSGGQVGQTLEIKIEFSPPDCIISEKWRLMAPGVVFQNAEQEMSLGPTTQTLTWRSASPLPAGVANPLNVQLVKTHGTGASLTPVQTVPVTIAPAAATPAAAPAAPTATAPPANPAAAPAAPATLPQPLQVQVVGGQSSAARWINGAGIMGWLGAAVILGLAALFLWIVFAFIFPTAVNGLSGGVTNVPTGQSMVVTEVKQTTVSGDSAVLQEATEASANISH